MGKACLVDTTKCIGCRSCQVACKQWNELPAENTRLRGTGGGYENPPALSWRTYTRVTFHEILKAGGELERSVFVKRQCMHCEKPSCVAACPVEALEKVTVDGKPAGPVVYHANKCMGCRYCMMACPFDIPTLEWDRLAPTIRKCTFCADRSEDAQPAQPQVNDEPLGGESLERFQEGQRTPACAKVCPTGAITFGEREKLIAEASRRIAARNRRPNASWQYIDHIYGEKEVGGTTWLYISNVPLEELGFRTDLGEQPYPDYTNLALDAIPAGAMAIGAVMGGAYWFAQRRNRVLAAETTSDADA